MIFISFYLTNKSLFFVRLIVQTHPGWIAEINVQHITISAAEATMQPIAVATGCVAACWCFI
jgi:hypothetical protein